MGKVPYGYRIAQGKAVPDEEKAKRFNRFLIAYLSGKSVSVAMKESGVDMSVSGMQDYMKRGTYGGTSFFPRIVPDGTLDRVTAELQRRSHPGTQKAQPPVPVRTHFRVKAPDVNSPQGRETINTAADIASALYGRIAPVDGTQSARQIASSAEMKTLRTLATELILTGTAGST